MSSKQTNIKSLARTYTAAAVKTLVGIMKQPKAPPAARVAAANSLLDRGWGKPAQALTGEDGGPLKVVVVRFSDDSSFTG